MLKTFTAAHWKNRRASEIAAARDCRLALTDPAGFYRLDASDPRVVEAVGKWVTRARRAHAIALGREPLCARFTVITNEVTATGPLYAA